MKDDINPDYNEFSAADFALDEFFIKWVLHKSPEADRFWSEWSKANPSKKSEIDSARALVLALRFKEEEILDSEVGAEWKALRSRLDTTTDEGAISYDDARPRVFVRILRVAAAILVGVALTWFFVPSSTTVDEQITMVEYATVAGQKMSLMLPDGTSVTLNSGSRISYPERFSHQRRDIQLEGEAYFDVVSDSTRPFSVRTDNVTTVVLGTSFNVRAYSEDRDISIALVEGRVKVDQRLDSTTREFYLRPTEMLTVNRADTTHVMGQFHLLEVLGWKDGLLYFNKTSFPEAISRIERWYGVEIDIAPGVKLDTHWRFNGKFQNRPLGEVLRAFSYPDLFKYRIEDESVTIYEGVGLQH